MPWARSPKVFVYAAGVGVIAGFVAALFQLVATLLQRFLIGPGSLLAAARQLQWWEAILIPVGGSVVAALLAYGLTRKRPAQGMSDVMEAVTLRREEGLSIRATISRALSSLALIATGGSLGREGPNCYLGASFATRFARLARAPGRELRIYTGCGVAAGMAASYFAPFGSALFALEVVLGNFAVEVFAPVVIASVVADLIVEGLALGPLEGYVHGRPLYEFPTLTEARPAEVLIYLLLGCFAALAGWLFIHAMRRSERIFKSLPLPPQLRLPIGGLLVGIIGIWLPEVWGNGYDAVNLVIKDAPLLRVVALLFLMKIIATSISLGSGGSGGIFTPTMFIGVALGLLVGEAGHTLLPDVVHDPRPYAVVGMAATIAATTQAPIMAIFLLFEMTRETNLVLPLMIAAMSASLTARALGLDSVYLATLRRKGLQIPEGIEETALTTTRVRDIMRERVTWILESATFDMIVGMVMKTRRDAIYVVDGQQHLLGVVRLHDIKNYLGEEELGAAVIAADLTVAAPCVTQDQTLAEVLPHFDDPETDELAVVDTDRNLLGVVDRRDLLTALSVEVLQNQQLRAKFVEYAGAQHYVEIQRGHAVSRIPVPKDLVGRTLAACDFRRRTGLTVLTIVRANDGREVRIQAEPSTMLQERDALIVMGSVDSIRSLGGTA